MRIFFISVVTVLVTLLNINTLWAIDKKAEAYYNKGNYQKAAERWQKIGDREDDSGISFYKLAQLYRDGLGVEKDARLEISWLQRSARKGYVPAMYELGEAYMWRIPEIKDVNFAIYWFEQAVAQNDLLATQTLANLLMQPPLTDLLKARSLGVRLLTKDVNAATDIFLRIDKQIQDLNIGGSRNLHELNENLFTLEFARFNDFASAWYFVVKNELKNAFIYRSIYSDFVVISGQYPAPLEAFQGVSNLPDELKQFKPRVRAFTVIKSQIIAQTNNFSANWVFDQPADKFTVELFRGASIIEAMDFIDLNGLANSSIYRTRLAEYVVIAGVFDSQELAQAVVSQLPPKMTLFNPVHRSFSAAQADAHLKSNQIKQLAAPASAWDLN